MMPMYHVSRTEKKKKRGIYVKINYADTMDVFDEEDSMMGL